MNRVQPHGLVDRFQQTLVHGTLREQADVEVIIRSTSPLAKPRHDQIVAAVAQTLNRVGPAGLDVKKTDRWDKEPETTAVVEKPTLVTPPTPPEKPEGRRKTLAEQV